MNTPKPNNAAVEYNFQMLITMGNYHHEWILRSSTSNIRCNLRRQIIALNNQSVAR